MSAHRQSPFLVVVACAAFAALTIVGCSGSGPRSGQPSSTSPIESGKGSTSRTAFDGIGSPMQVFGSDRR
jgi:hypothetical protein